MPDDDLRFTDLLDPSFQELLCAALVSDEQFLARARSIVEPKYFSADLYRGICEALFKYWDTYREMPAGSLLKIEVSKLAPTPEVREEWVGAVDRLYSVSEEERSGAFIAHELVEFVQRAQAASVVSVASKDLRSFDMEKLRETLDKILKIRALFEDLGTDLRRDWGLSYLEDPRKVFRCGFSVMDDAMRLGMREGELIAILAPLKRGKTLVLINIGVRMLLLGYNVVHYSLEMQELDILKRYIACIAGLPVNFLHEHVRDVSRAIELLDLVTPPETNVVIKQFPAKRARCEDLEAHMNLLTGVYVPIVDYADLLVGPSNREEWSELSEIYMQLRNLGAEYNVPVITASQTNASGFDAPELAAGHVSGSTRKGFHADYMWGLNQSNADYKINRFRLVPFLNRNERKDRPAFFRVEYDRARMIPIDKDTWVALGRQHAGNDEEGPGQGLDE
jgi:hypothetical protein